MVGRNEKRYEQEREQGAGGGGRGVNKMVRTPENLKSKSQVNLNPNRYTKKSGCCLVLPTHDKYSLTTTTIFLNLPQLLPG